MFLLFIISNLWCYKFLWFFFFFFLYLQVLPVFAFLFLGSTPALPIFTDLVLSPDLLFIDCFTDLRGYFTQIRVISIELFATTVTFFIHKFNNRGELPNNKRTLAYSFLLSCPLVFRVVLLEGPVQSSVCFLQVWRGPFLCLKQNKQKICVGDPHWDGTLQNTSTTCAGVE